MNIYYHDLKEEEVLQGVAGCLLLTLVLGTRQRQGCGGGAAQRAPRSPAVARVQQPVGFAIVLLVRGRLPVGRS